MYRPPFVPRVNVPKGLSSLESQLLPAISATIMNTTGRNAGNSPLRQYAYNALVDNHWDNENFEELTNWWGDEQLSGYMDFSAKRLLLFAPYASYWKTISDNWDNVMHYPSVAGAGLKEIDYNQIIDAISNSI